MKKLLNTVYITSPDAYISRDGMNLVISASGKELGRVPIGNIEQVTTFGHSGASPSAMRLCVENGVSLSFHSASGRFQASVEGELRGNVLLRRAQYRLADDQIASLEISKNMITAKCVNGLRVIQKGMSNHPELLTPAAISALDRFKASIDAISTIDSVNSLRGIEGESAHLYFALLDKIILSDKESFYIRDRNRRPPRDAFNAILSFLYSMLMNDVRSALNSVGLDPFVGVMHTDRPGRASLALDMMEELRPLADRTAVRLVNLRMVSIDGFIIKEDGAVMMDEETRRTVINEWQQRKNDSVKHPYLGEHIQRGLIPYVQSKLLSKVIYGELDAYPPYFMVN